MNATLSLRGIEVPRIGFGTSKLEGPAGLTAVRTALDLGYRHVDTAADYDNEEIVGRAIHESGVDREDIFLVTKIWFDQLSTGALLNSLRTSLRKLDTDHVDLALVHWPTPTVPLSETLDALRTARDLGLCHRFGVSNFTPALLEATLQEAEPFALQVEYHPYLGQSELLAMCRAHDMMLTAYSPLMRGDVARDPVLNEIAREHDASPSQIALAYLLRDEHVSVIPRSSNPDHIRANLAATRIALTDSDIARIDGLPKDHRLIDPDWAPDWTPRPSPAQP